MGKYLISTVLLLFSSQALASIKVCLNTNTTVNIYYSLDAVIYENQRGSECFLHDPVGNQVILFTNRFNLMFNNTSCGFEKPCVIPLIKNNSYLSKLTASVVSVQEKIAGGLKAEYISLP